MPFLSDQLFETMKHAYESGTACDLAGAFVDHHFKLDWTATGSYLDYDGETLSYFPASKTGVYVPDRWTSGYRVSGRPGRVLRKFLADLGQTYTDSDIENMVNSLYAAFTLLTDNLEIERVSGGEIAEVYDDSDGPDSCMSNMGYYMGLYVNNPTTIQMLAAYEDGTLMARALIFNVRDQGWYLDGVYGPDKYREAIRVYAYENGIKTALTHPAYVNVVNGDYEHYPYLDTFRYYNMFTGELSSGRTTDWTHELSCTSGNANSTNVTQCDECGTYDYNNNVAYVLNKHWCESCQEDRQCSDCGTFTAEPNNGRCYCCAAAYACEECDETQDTKLEGGVCDTCIALYSCKECGEWQGENLSYRDGQCPMCWRADLRIDPPALPNFAALFASP